jgi:hypothetical protein
MDQDRALAAPLDMIMLARHDDDRLVAEARAGAQLGFDIGPDSAADGRLEGADVDDPHRPASSRESAPTSSEAFLMRMRPRPAA